MGIITGCAAVVSRDLISGAENFSWLKRLCEHAAQRFFVSRTTSCLRALYYLGCKRTRPHLRAAFSASLLRKFFIRFSQGARLVSLLPGPPRWFSSHHYEGTLPCSKKLYYHHFYGRQLPSQIWLSFYASSVAEPDQLNCLLLLLLA